MVMHKHICWNNLLEEAHFVMPLLTMIVHKHIICKNNSRWKYIFIHQLQLDAQCLQSQCAKAVEPTSARARRPTSAWRPFVYWECSWTWIMFFKKKSLQIEHIPGNVPSVSCCWLEHSCAQCNCSRCRFAHWVAYPACETLIWMSPARDIDPQEPLQLW